MANGVSQESFTSKEKPTKCDTDIADTSVESLNPALSSTSTLGSVLSVSVTSKKQKNAARKKSLLEKRKEKKRMKKVEQNKISKDDFYMKHTEFRTWLWEEKNIKFEELTATKSKDYFKKFVKKWNNKKLPKNYYRGIASCWFDGSPATQSLWALPKDVEMTPGSIDENILDIKYSRASTDVKSLGTFGKRRGQQALRRLQSMFTDNFSETTKNENDTYKPNNFSTPKDSSTRSSSSLPEVSTIVRFAPKPPRRTCSLNNVDVSKHLTQVFEDDLLDKENDRISHITTEFVTRTSQKRSSPRALSSSHSSVAPRKMQKQDMSSSQSDRTSHSFFNAVCIPSSRKPSHASISRKVRPVSADSSTLWKRSGADSQQSTMSETPRCATLRHSTHLRLFPSSFDTNL